MDLKPRRRGPRSRAMLHARLLQISASRRLNQSYARERPCGLQLFGMERSFRLRSQPMANLQKFAVYLDFHRVRLIRNGASQRVIKAR